jgi:ABC-type multidrug transport system ATPase subunit
MDKENRNDCLKKDGITLRWSNLIKVIQDANAVVPKSRHAILKSVLFGDSVKRDTSLNEGGRVILNNVSGKALPGQVLGIMGPSGAGKTTLLNVLAGRAAYDSGIYQSSFKTEKDKKKIAYITQKDVFFTTLTVRDQLMYTALLRLPGTKQEKISEVDRIIQLLRLQKCQNTQIKLISGGESKRVNIGTELLTNPSVILLDEPTSGLDSTAAVSLLRTLREDLALKHNKTIITSIHQPSSPIFSQALDQIMFLADGGFVVYHGTPANSLLYLRNVLGVPCPEGYNAADHWMDLLVGTDETNNHAELLLLKNGEDVFSNEEEKKEDSHFDANKLEGTNMDRKDMIKTSVELNGRTSEIDEEAGVVVSKNRRQSSILFGNRREKEQKRRRERVFELADTQRKVITEAQNISMKAILISRWESFQVNEPEKSYLCQHTNDIKDDNKEVTSQNTQTTKYPVSWWSQYKILTHRAFKNSKEAIFTPLNITKSIILGLMTGFMWFQMDDTEKYVHDRSSFFFFSLTFWSFNAMFAAIFSFPMERTIIFKERASGSYHLSAYFLAKTTSEAPTLLSLPAMFFIIAYWLAGINKSFVVFLATGSIILLSVCVGESMGLLCGALVMDLERAMTIMIIISLTMMVSGGFFVENMPPFFSWVKYLSPFKYAFDASRELIFDYDVKCDGTNNVCGGLNLNVATSSLVKDYLKIENSVALNVGILFCIFVIPRYLAFLSLQRKKAGER